MIIDDKFSILWDFYKEIAIMFINIIFMKSDFLILRWEKDEYHLSLMNLSLKEII